MCTLALSTRTQGLPSRHCLRRMYLQGLFVVEVRLYLGFVHLHVKLSLSCHQSATRKARSVRTHQESLQRQFQQSLLFGASLLAAWGIAYGYLTCTETLS